jgi:hypothetical protein
LKINRVIVLITMLFFVGCGIHKNNGLGSYKFNFPCFLTVKYYENSFSGDCYVYGDEKDFFIDAFSFGTQVFRMHQQGDKIILYLDGKEFEYGADDRFFSVSYIYFKNILLSFLNNNYEEWKNENNYEIKTERNSDKRSLTILDTTSGNFIKIAVKQ